MIGAQCEREKASSCVGLLTYLNLDRRILLRVSQDADSGFVLLQLVVDADERARGAVGRLAELGLAISQRLGEGTALFGQMTEGRNVDRKRLVIVLHELGQVQERLKDLGRNVGRHQGRLEILDKVLLAMFRHLRQPSIDPSIVWVSE